MIETGYAIIFITAGSEAEAEKLSSIILRDHHAACVNIVEGIKSTYWWQGKLESARENLLIVKTRQSQVDGITRIIRENHSYNVPEVVVVPVTGGNPDYLEWIGSEVPEIREGMKKYAE